MLHAVYLLAACLISELLGLAAYRLFPNYVPLWFICGWVFAVSVVFGVVASQLQIRHRRRQRSRP